MPKAHTITRITVTHYAYPGGLEILPAAHAALETHRSDSTHSFDRR